MPGTIPRRRRILIDGIVRAARGLQRTPPAALLRQYFAGVGEEELAARAPRDLAALATAHAALAARRKPGETLVRVLPPGGGEHATRPTSIALVVTDDRPFLVDSIGLAFAREGIAVHTLIHPVLQHRGRSESWQLHEIDPQFDADARARLEESLRAGLADVQVAVEDWSAMRRRVSEAARALDARGRGADEAVALLAWMEGAHFVFQGYQRLRLRRGRGSDRLLPVRGSGLGVLRDGHAADERIETLRGALRASVRSTEPLRVSKSPQRSTVHRPGHLDQIAVKEFDAAGRVVGEHRFVGLWTSTAYFASPVGIPVVRRKVAAVVERFGLDPRSHDGKAVLAVLETWPRDELFQAGVAELVGFVRGAVNLYERRTTRLIMRHDASGGFWSCMVFVPRDRYNTEARRRIEQLLLARLGGRDLESQVEIALSSHARLHVMVRGGRATDGGRIDHTALESGIAAAVATWQDGLREALLDSLPAEQALRRLQRHGARFPPAYQSEVDPVAALADIESLEALAAAPLRPQLRLWRPSGAPRTRLHLRLARLGETEPIAALLPVLENFGLRMLAERPWRIAPDPQAAADTTGVDGADIRPVALQDFELELRTEGRGDDGTRTDPLRAGERLLDALRAVRDGTLDDDPFNRLVLLTPLDGHQVGVLRACCRWLLQTGIPFSLAYMARTLAAHPGIAADLYRLFELRLDPARAPKRTPGRTAAAAEGLAARLRERLDAVVDADEDRILRAFLGVVLATLRTNFFARGDDGARRPALALKIDPQGLPELPLPRPYREIYVHGGRVEGVHLRMGEVARGGIRWSDRREDFRTEVLGLMKAQNVKNTLIVPVGAKGGFVPRRLPVAGGREALQAEGVAAYREYIGALLDVTDDIRGRRIVPPTGVRRLDGDDPYLVVAADKGTATFSDIANGISVARGFWLGDAFASGGSAGYDHKKMGITARGAWECVKRHFRELGHDTQTQPFTVAGIGDMSGDVFGNGMLLSRQIKLVAAFNHQHVFLDPAPDPARSFAERARLFALPRSGWNDYDRRAISKGGGIFERSAKSIALSAEARAMLGIQAPAATPQEIIRAVLRMPVDLLWNGGIGTYVKASTEPQSAAGDRTNDGVRVDGRELRARVVGEGGNLGLTQRGRVEYALTGGRLNTDFIDNSAGVNTSDVEVNLKILTTQLEARGTLKRAARDRLLARLTDEVAGLVLRNNQLQSQALSMLQLQSAQRLPELQGLVRELERRGELNRAVEHLPDDETFAQRRKLGLGLARPELAVLLSYSKIWLTRQLLASDLPEDPGFAGELIRYFPQAVRERYPADIRRHRLRREIIATAVTNSLVNRMGPTFVGRVCAETGASAADVARAWGIARQVFGARELWVAVESLDHRTPAAAQYAVLGDSARLLRHATVWLLRRRRDRLAVDAAVKEYAAAVAQLRTALPRVLAGTLLETFEAARVRHVSAGIPAALAGTAAGLPMLDAALEICEIAHTVGLRVEDTARAWFTASGALGLDRLEARIEALTVDGPLQATARTGLRDALRGTQARILKQLLSGAAGRSGESRWQAWRDAHATGLDDWQRTTREVFALGQADFAALSVCVEALRSLAE